MCHNDTPASQWHPWLTSAFTVCSVQTRMSPGRLSSVWILHLILRWFVGPLWVWRWANTENWTQNSRTLNLVSLINVCYKPTPGCLLQASFLVPLLSSLPLSFSPSTTPNFCPWMLLISTKSHFPAFLTSETPSSSPFLLPWYTSHCHFYIIIWFIYKSWAWELGKRGAYGSILDNTLT